MKHCLTLTTFLLLLSLSAASSPFVGVGADGGFVRDGAPYKYVGANMWYGAILGSEGRGGDRARLCLELDSLRAAGIDNLRVLVGGDGRPRASKIQPALQTAPGEYNDTVFAGLDYLLAEMSKRRMVAVLYLNNSWEWSGGYSQYLEWAGEGDAPVPSESGWDAFNKYVARYATCQKAQRIFEGYVRHVVRRTNRYTGVRYVDDPTIMSWQIGNEPRPFGRDNADAFATWMSKVSRLIKSLDQNHLVSTGSEGSHGCDESLALFERIHTDPNIDYMNIHIWPYNWGWVQATTLADSLATAKAHTKEYIDQHYAIAARHHKPLVLEEFGFPRDGSRFDRGSCTEVRDAYFRYVFSLVAGTGSIAGCNFWSWGGAAKPRHTIWQPGDDYTGDPAQEQQGLNSVFLDDTSTMRVIRQAAKQIACGHKMTE